MTVKKIIRRMLSMHPAAWYIFINSVRASCAMLAVSLLLFAGGGYDAMAHYELYSAAVALSEAAPALLLLAVIVSACVEDRLT